jgi:hypothetical protein
MHQPWVHHYKHVAENASPIFLCFSLQLLTFEFLNLRQNIPNPELGWVMTKTCIVEACKPREGNIFTLLLFLIFYFIFSSREKSRKDMKIYLAFSTHYGKYSIQNTQLWEVSLTTLIITANMVVKAHHLLLLLFFARSKSVTEVFIPHENCHDT